MNPPVSSGLDLKVQQLRHAALSTNPVAGLTHRFYRYPARFSPDFAASAIQQFSGPGDLVLDPYMGGATTIVEALANGRRAIGCDVNSLAVFVARVKTTPLGVNDRRSLAEWADDVVPALMYSDRPENLDAVICADRTRNLNVPIARPIKKILALALLSLDGLPSEDARNFARCALLNAGQWALNGRQRTTPLHEFRPALRSTIRQMLNDLETLEKALRRSSPAAPPVFINDSAAALDRHAVFTGQKASLVVTSPPYPGIHMLYHRWQVDGRKESPAPYWLANCHDGHGSSYYTFASREAASDVYFAESLRTLKSIRAVMKPGAFMIQMIAFGTPRTQLPRYLENMALASFEPAIRARDLITRRVPGRRWHATLKGSISASHEVVLIHRAT